MIKYQAGDTIEIFLDEEIAERLNRNCDAIFDPSQVINHEPKPFDWNDVKQGMAFAEGNKIFWYAAPFFMQEDTHVILFSGLTGNGYPHTPIGNLKSNLTRIPEHDFKKGKKEMIKYQAGDTIQIVLDSHEAQTMNEYNKIPSMSLSKIIRHTPKPFELKDIKPGMAFRNSVYTLFHYIGLNVSGQHVFDFNGNGPKYSDDLFLRYSAFELLRSVDLIRVPEKDIPWLSGEN